MAKRKFIAIIEVDDDGLDGEKWEGGREDMAIWLDHVMCPLGANHEVSTVIYASIADLVADNLLGALAESG